jgi:hypothetical protein
MNPEIKRLPGKKIENKSALVLAPFNRVDEINAQPYKTSNASRPYAVFQLSDAAIPGLARMRPVDPTIQPTVKTSCDRPRSLFACQRATAPNC